MQILGYFHNVVLAEDNGVLLLFKSDKQKVEFNALLEYLRNAVKNAQELWATRDYYYARIGNFSVTILRKPDGVYRLDINAKNDNFRFIITIDISNSSGVILYGRVGRQNLRFKSFEFEFQPDERVRNAVNEILDYIAFANKVIII